MDADFIRDLFAGFGPVQVRRMFGGLGVYADGLMFALVAQDVLYLKVAPEETGRFSSESCGPFEYGSKTGKRTITSYWRVPDRLYDQTDELAEWARRALAAAKRAPAARKH